MNDSTRQQHPECAAPRVPAEKCEDSQEYVDNKADSVGDSGSSHRLYQQGQRAPPAGESPQRFEDMTIPSGDIE